MGFEQNPDPFLLEGRLEQLGRVAIDARHQPVAALHDRHLGAEPPVELRQLAAGDAAAQHDQARRHLVGRGRLSRRPGLDALQPFDGRRTGEEPVATTR